VDFDRLILESVDEALTDILATRTTQALYCYLEQNHSIRRDQLPEKLDVFEDVCKNLFGAGRGTIAKAIARRLYSKLGWAFWEVATFGLVDYVNRARIRLARELTHQKEQSWLRELETL